MTNEEKATWLEEAVRDSLETAWCLMKAASAITSRSDIDVDGINDAISAINGAGLAMYTARNLVEHLEAEGDE